MGATKNLKDIYAARELTVPIFLNEVELPEDLPPIVLLAFTRPDLLEQVLAAIAKQTLMPKKILAFIDGARNEKDKILIEKSINLLQEFSNTVSIDIISRPRNLGCDVNAVTALTQVFNDFPATVYLEDDVVPNPYFYDRMCRLLVAYRDSSQVFSVAAYANFPHDLERVIQEDFMVSQRVFPWGWGTWADRWHDLNLANYKQGYNPFGNFYKIPATIQTKYTIINQFFLENNHQQDWVITLTLACLYKRYVHITPMVSFVHNIGFGHPEAKTYNKGGEPHWVNAHSDPSANLNKLPLSLKLVDRLADSLEGVEFAKHLQKYPSLWLSPSATWYLIRKYPGWQSKIAFLELFFARIVTYFRHWRATKKSI
ncbi:sugar transferase [Scytonema sp. NUACC26]|uniref:sugar transferase n=1 Tax=Scytonema sp. NUACC26 TaxID=3140176 RepID=UPI0034DC6F5F